MRIAYFTTAQDYEEFKSFCIEKGRNANTSNQVFHNNMIECLAMTNEVEVFSTRYDAASENEAFTKKVGNVTWHYLKTKKDKYANNSSQISEIKKTVIRCDIALTGTVNPRCIKIAKTYARKNGIQLIGVVTDSPYNITNSQKFYSWLTLHYAKKCDAYICLTPALNKLFNPRKRNSIIMQGLSKKDVEDSNPPVDYQYFFYAGTLLPKYGVVDLVKAFDQFKGYPVKLVIAGHHKNAIFERAIENNPQIVFLGSVDNSVVLNYESHAVANINPRPFMSNIDKLSIPSKVIEYLSKDTVIISGYSSLLKDKFLNSILWIDENNSLADRMKEAYEIDSFRKKAMIGENQYIYKAEYSFEANNKKLDEFITKCSNRFY